jgi:hypothetical protein
MRCHSVGSGTLSQTQSATQRFAAVHTKPRFELPASLIDKQARFFQNSAI